MVGRGQPFSQMMHHSPGREWIEHRDMVLQEMAQIAALDKLFNQIEAIVFLNIVERFGHLS